MKNAEDQLIELSQLRWHCRRGVKELDVVLSNYLDNHYLDSADENQQAFKDLLKLEDPILMSLIMEQKEIKDEETAQTQVLIKMKQPYSCK